MKNYPMKEALLDPIDQKGIVTQRGFVKILVCGRLVSKHRYLWEMKNGPIPKGRKMRCLDGNKQNHDPSNWEIVPQLPRNAQFRKIRVNGKDVYGHRVLWEKANGPIPKGMVLRCLSSDRQNTDPSNWEMVPNGVVVQANNLMAINNLPEEFRETAITVAKLRHRVADLKKSRSPSLSKAEGRTAD
jgi:hypothetical protein